MDWTNIILLTVTGLVLLAVDFYLPGFVLGSIGIVLMLVATGLVYAGTHSIGGMMVAFLAEVALGFSVAFVAIKYFPQTAWGRKMILSETQTGVRAQKTKDADLIGQQGVAQTALRPSGMAMIDGKRVDVAAESGVIERGSAIKIVAVRDNQIIVRKA